MNYFRLLTLSAVAAMATVNVGAETLAENPLTIEPLEVTPGEVTDIVMYYETSEQYQGFEFQIKLPEGVNFVADPDSDDGKDMDIPLINTTLARTHQFSGYIQEPGVCKAIMVSMRNAVIKSGGWILKIPVEVSESFSGMGTGSLYNCRFGADDGQREDEYLTGTDFMVYVAPTSISLSSTSLTLGLDDTGTLSVEYQPTTAYQMPLTWTSSDPSVVAVDKSGNYNTLKDGKATITASVTDKPEIKAVCEIEVDSSISTGIDSAIQNGGLIDVFTVDGIALITGATTQRLNRLAPGMYIIKSGDRIAKVRIASK